MMDKAKVDYSRFTIIKEYDLKKKSEEIGISIDEVTILSIDAVNMNPY